LILLFRKRKLTMTADAIDPTNETQEQQSLTGEPAPALPDGALPEPETHTARRSLFTRRQVLIAPFTLLAGLGAGYILWKQTPAPLVLSDVLAATGTTGAANATPAGAPAPLPERFPLPVAFTDLGPRLVAAGAIDLPRFIQLNAEAGKPLTDEQQALLTVGSDATLTIDGSNAYFLLNLFWALGLTNRNPILTEGAMVQRSGGQIESFASTGGWTLATQPIADLYASTPLITLAAHAQARLESVAAGVYRPCCDNSTAFPDCNHGMAMLGLLELMAAQGASAAQMAEAAKAVNAFWFPQQMAEVATLLRATEGLAYADADPLLVTGANYSSASGFQGIHRWLVDTGRLGQPATGGNGCGV
jgi:hypothetical protein